MANQDQYGMRKEKDPLNHLADVTPGIRRNDCRFCGTPLGNRPGQARYCNLDCRNQDYYKVVYTEIKELTCKSCKKPFMPRTRRKQEFCNVRCYYDNKARVHKESTPPRDCQQCGERFIPPRRHQIYCSVQCRRKMMVMAYQLGYSARDLRHLEVPSQNWTPDQEARIEQLKQEAAARQQKEKGARIIPASNPEIPQGMTTALCELCSLAHVETEIDTLCESCKKSEQAQIEAKAIKEAKQKWENTPK